MKDKVVVEPLESDWSRVTVLYYDAVTQCLTNEVLEVTSRGDVDDKYVVVGELIDGELKLYDEELDSDFDYDYEDITEDLGLDEEWLDE